VPIGVPNGRSLARTSRGGFHAAAIEIARAQLFDVDADRKKRIDRLIDYFGTPLIAVARDRVCRSPAAQIIVLADWQGMET
jgi:hypothetical protein